MIDFSRIGLFLERLGQNLLHQIPAIAVGMVRIALTADVFSGAAMIAGGVGNALAETLQPDAKTIKTYQSKIVLILHIALSAVLMFYVSASIGLAYWLLALFGSIDIVLAISFRVTFCDAISWWTVPYWFRAQYSRMFLIASALIGFILAITTLLLL